MCKESIANKDGFYKKFTGQIVYPSHHGNDSYGVVKNAAFELKDGKIYWNDGDWIEGAWGNGIWKEGNFFNGRWEAGVWEDGIWHCGLWCHGTWKNGIWISGEWWDGVWHGGYDEDGNFHDKQDCPENWQTNSYDCYNDTSDI